MMILGDLGELISECEKNMKEESARYTAPFSWAEAEADFYCRLKNAVIVDAVPVVHGEWISKEMANHYFDGVFECSVCGFQTDDTCMGEPRANFCQNCGADMRERK